MFKFQFKNLGPLKEASIDLSPLTIICGRNNVGKTYISYKIYDSLKSLKNSIEKIDSSLIDQIEIKEKSIDGLLRAYDLKSCLEKMFPPGESLDSNHQKTELAFVREILLKIYNLKIEDKIYKFSHINAIVNKDPKDFEIRVTLANFNNEYQFDSLFKLISLSVIGELIEKMVDFSLFIAISERTGLAIFQPIFDEINSKRNQLAFLKQDIANIKHEKKYLDGVVTRMFKNIPTPLLDNIDICRSRKTELSELRYFSEIQKLIGKISGGEFFEEKDVRFKPTGTDIYLDLSMVSSSAKSIYLIQKIIKYELKPGSIIIIDEPELNLHLDNQVLMARLLATLVNSEITVVITTHSDHMLREINNLIMLGSGNMEEEDQQELMSEFDVDKSCLLTSEQVSAYVVSSREKKVFPAEISKYGIDLELFNEEIVGNNQKIRKIRNYIID